MLLSVYLMESVFTSPCAAKASVVRKYCCSIVSLVQESADSTVTSLQSNMECDVYIRKELYAISFCQTQNFRIVTWISVSRLSRP